MGVPLRHFGKVQLDTQQELENKMETAGDDKNTVIATHVEARSSKDYV